MFPLAFWWLVVLFASIHSSAHKERLGQIKYQGDRRENGAGMYFWAEMYVRVR